ncbi:MAG: hypothetical protein PVI21_05930 [Candidatus Woesebacteria bacterium]|jgi:hypothetical protein
MIDIVKDFWTLRRFFAALLAFIAVMLLIVFNVADTKTTEESGGCNPYGAVSSVDDYLKSHKNDSINGIVTHVDYQEISWFFGIRHSSVLTIKLRSLNNRSKTVKLHSDNAKANEGKFKPGDHVAITSDDQLEPITAKAVSSPCG